MDQAAIGLVGLFVDTSDARPLAWREIVDGNSSTTSVSSDGLPKVCSK